MRRSPWLLVALLVGCFSAGEEGQDEVADTSGSETGECPVGSESCPCTAGGSCDAGLMCSSDVCVPESNESESSTDTDESTDTTESETTDTTDETETGELPQACDPLLQDCPVGEGCYLVDGGNAGCETAGQVPIGSPCVAVNDCAPGGVCVYAMFVPGCNGENCCASFCDLVDPQCPMGLECTSIYEEGTAPPGLEDVGACIVLP